jgi:hypothetical protein
MRQHAATIITTLGILIGLPVISTAQAPTSIGLVASVTCSQNPFGTVNLSDPAPAASILVKRN